MSSFSSSFKHHDDFIGLFAQHPVAANLLMIIMLLSGFWALSKLNTQFLPNFDLNLISVRVVWSGASAEDVETSITSPIEQELRSLDNLKKMTSTSAQGVSAISLEYYDGSDMSIALDQVKERIALLRNLPTTAEKPEISTIIRYELIARLLLTGPNDPTELRHLVRRMEQELLDRGIAKIEVAGLPEEEMAIQIPAARLEELGLSLPQVADKIAGISRDLPAGSIGRNDVSRQLRSLDQRREEQAFLDIPLVADQQGKLVTVNDIAQVERRPKQGEGTLRHEGKPAVEMELYRTENSDTLKAARIYQEWLAEIRTQLPPNIQIKAYDESWNLLNDRITLLLKNGGLGLILVIAALLLFLNTKVAWWVAMGIPIALLGSMVILLALGGSINMVSLFGMIMTLGIIVDDAIVVGEDGFTHYQLGERSLQAAEGGARRMLAPVMASSLTTVTAFLPLIIISGIIGHILREIPLVVICALIASLVESFLILPGHLRQSFLTMHHQQPSRIRQALENGFEWFKNQLFRPLVTMVVDYRWVTLSATLAILLLGVGLLQGGRINFTFFPTPDADMITANVNFAAGTPPTRVNAFLEQLQQTLNQTDQHYGGNIVKTVVARHGMSAPTGVGISQRGDQFGSLVVQLSAPDSRQVRNHEFIKNWRERVEIPPGLENYTISERRGGPPGRDIEIRLTGISADKLKTAALELSEALKTLPGVNAIEDDLPFGREQLIYRLRPEAIALGLTVAAVGQQLRAAFDGQLVQIFLDGKDEVEVRVMLPDEERYNLASLEHFTLQLPNGSSIPLLNAVQLTPRRGFEALRHHQSQLAVLLTADVDKEVSTAGEVLSTLEQSILPQLVKNYGLQYSYEGRAAEQAETLADMKRGVIFALAMIYLVMVWILMSYGWPIVILIAIPFGLMGAIVGHWVMGINLTLISLFGFFGLSGIAVNDSIVLVTFYRQLREDQQMAVQPALVEAACQRLRAVLLTSLTTIGGLLPIVFETSLQAQFLIPMAISISFGLMFSTVLVLLLIPALLGIYELNFRFKTQTS